MPNASIFQILEKYQTWMIGRIQIKTVKYLFDLSTVLELVQAWSKNLLERAARASDLKKRNIPVFDENVLHLLIGRDKVPEQSPPRVLGCLCILNPFGGRRLHNENGAVPSCPTVEVSQTVSVEILREVMIRSQEDKKAM